MSRNFSPSRWAWTLPVATAALVAACDNSLQSIDRQDTWGFIMVSASQASDGQYYTSPEGLFFKGNLASVPNGEIALDSCADASYHEGNNLAGVTHLDAGEQVVAVLSGTTNEMVRTTSPDGLSYLLPAGDAPYTPGDSIFVTVPGVSGGFPSGSIRAKTAEAFQLPTIDPPAGTDGIMLNWTAPQVPGHSSFIVSLRYKSGGSATYNRQVLCTFVDDGVDSIPFRWHQTWSESTGDHEVVATRLRTNYVAAGNANLGVISTFQVPTPVRNP